MQGDLTRVNGYFEVTIPAYLSGEFENHFRMTRKTCQLLTQEMMHPGHIRCTSGRPASLPEQQILLFLRSVANREPHRTIADISCEWNTKFSIIPEIPSKRVHSKRIPRFSKTFPGIFTVPFSFEPEISKLLVEWKAPLDFYKKNLKNFRVKNYRVTRNKILFPLHSTIKVTTL